MSDDNASYRRDEPASATAALNGGSYRDRSPSPRRDRDDRGRSASPGRRMDVDRNDRGRGPPPGGDNPGNNLHVSSLAIRLDQRDLETHFAKYGVVDKVQIMYDPHTKESRGFAFVTMATSEEADAAIASLNGTELGGKTMRVEKARRGRARTPTPGRYFGPPKPDDRRPGGYPPPRGGSSYGGGGGHERPYDPRPYDSRYADRDLSYRRYDDYPPSYPPSSSSYSSYPSSTSYGGRYDGYADEPRGGRYDDRRGDDRYGAPPPPRRREYEDRPYVPSGGGGSSRGGDYSAPPPPRGGYDAPRGGGGRRDEYAAPMTGYDERRPPPRDGGRDERRY